MADTNLQFIITADATGAVLNVRRYGDELKKLGTASQNVTNQSTAGFNRLNSIIGKMKSAVTALIAAMVFRAAINGIRDMLGLFVAFEDSFAGIRKTVDATEEEFAQLATTMRNMAREIPVAVTELNRIGQIGGQLGIGAANLGAFTETVAKFGIASGVSADEASFAFGRLANVMDDLSTEHQPSMEAFASVVVDLGNKYAATEQEILQFSLRLAGVGNTIGLASEEVAALAASLAASGLRAEKSGTAMGKVFVAMANAVASGSDDLAKFAEVAHMTTEDFATQFEDNASVALLAFLDGLRIMRDEGENVFKTFEDLSLQEIRVRDTLLLASSASKVFSDALRDAKEEAVQAGEAMETEFQKKMEASAQQLALLKNRMIDMGITIGSHVVPVLVDAAEVFVDVTEAVFDFVAANSELVIALTILAATWASVSIISWVGTFTAVSGAVATLTAAFTSLEGAIIGAYLAGTRLLALVSTPVSVASGLIGGVIIGARTLFTEIGRTRESVRAAREEQMDMFSGFIEGFNEMSVATGNANMVIDRNKDTVERVRTLYREMAGEVRLWQVTQNMATAEAVIAEQKMRDLEAAQKAYREEVQKGVDAFFDMAGGANVLNDVLDTLITMGVPMKTIMAEYGDVIEKTVEQLMILGRDVPPVLQALYDQMQDTPPSIQAINERMIELYDSSFDVKGVFEDMVNPLNRVGDEMEQTSEAMESYGRKMGEARTNITEFDAELSELIDISQDAGQAYVTSARLLSQYGDEAIRIVALADELGIEVSDATRAFAEQAAAITDADKAAQDMERTMATAMGNIVSDMAQGLSEALFNWENFGASLKEMVLDLAQSLLDAFLTGLFAPLTAAMQGLGSQLAGVLGGIFGGGGGFGGSTGGVATSIGGGLLGGLFGRGSAFLGGDTSGAAAGLGEFGLIGPAQTGGGLLGSLGGFFTNPWTIGIGGALALGTWVSGMFGQGREAADEWVQGYQIPYNQLVEQLWGGAGGIGSQGSLLNSGSFEEVQQRTMALINAYNQIRALGTQFAQQSDNHALVIRQWLQGENGAMAQHEWRLEQLRIKYSHFGEIPQFAGGVDFVYGNKPILAMLHPGEAVLTKQENQQRMSFGEDKANSVQANVTINIKAFNGTDVRRTVKSREFIEELRDVIETAAHGGLRPSRREAYT